MSFVHYVTVGHLDIDAVTEHRKATILAPLNAGRVEALLLEHGARRCDESALPSALRHGRAGLHSGTVVSWWHLGSRLVSVDEGAAVLTLALGDDHVMDFLVACATTATLVVADVGHGDVFSATTLTNSRRPGVGSGDGSGG